MDKPTREEVMFFHNKICVAINDPTRVQIFYELYEKPYHVSELAENLDIPQPTISRHLAFLRQRGLVVGTREGTKVSYELVDKRIVDVLQTMRGILKDIIRKENLKVSSSDYTDEEEL